MILVYFVFDARFYTGTLRTGYNMFSFHHCVTTQRRLLESSFSNLPRFSLFPGRCLSLGLSSPGRGGVALTSLLYQIRWYGRGLGVGVAMGIMIFDWNVFYDLYFMVYLSFWFGALPVFGTCYSQIQRLQYGHRRALLSFKGVGWVESLLLLGS